ncbi:SusC/RagA family TonB-linked outer membrane protein [Winogradskyella helgolandensis]|uniref:SusC/RagA family TonB-linked outer membrane protein n=1 Tax=Winogradskyella helgolandensis TaxID=2697010 RepID=UPI0015C17B00|nr:TonB-dependent receptor [Winogradskyella helgolandensis]
MKLKIKSTLIIFVLMCFSLNAQEVVNVKGQVVSTTDGMAVPGVNIIIVNTTKGTTTDFDGNYQIQVSKGDVLQFSYLGFATQLVTVGDATTINVSLAEDASLLDEIVVIGYGTQKKSHTTGSISKVVNDDLGQIAVSRVDDALVGQVSGVNIQATDGEAGAAPTITIRGVGSMAGDSTPLIVVDGVIVDPDFLGSLNMNDVESFEILKDAASAAIYGSKGSNGIIMITMKSGIEGKTRITYSTYTGFKEARKSDAYGYTTQSWADQQMKDNGEISIYTQAQLQTGTDRSWQDVFFDGGSITSHALSFRGGNKSTKFSASLNYSDDEGVLLGDNYTKYGARLKLDNKINDKVSIGVNLSPSYTDRVRFSESVHNVARHQPWLPIYHDEYTLQLVDPVAFPVEVGDYVRQNHFTLFDFNGDGVFDEELFNIGNSTNQNPYARVTERNRVDKKFKMFGSVYGKYKMAKGLTYTTTLSGSIQDTKRTDYMGTLAREQPTDAYMVETNQKEQYYIFDNFINYDISFGKHELGVTLGNSIETRDYFFSTIKGIGYENDIVQQISGATTIVAEETFGMEWQKRGISYISRLNYAYDDKYLLSFSMRRDGSSIFGSDFKYGNFAAASLGWNVADENFLRDSNVISTLKLRASYGVTGNDRLNTGSVDPDAQGSTSVLSSDNVLQDYYPHLSLLDLTSYVVDGTITTGYSPLNLANPELKWERLVEINPGVDFGFLNNKITGSVDWYQRTSDQLLLNNPVSSTTGFNSALVNLGEVKNEGFEFELRTRNINKRNFSWQSTIIATTNENTLVDFADSDGQITSIDPTRPAEWINQEGQPISSFYGYVVEAEVPIEYRDRPYRHVGNQFGLVQVKDLNGDGVLDEEDKTILGNPYPELIWSFTNDFKIGNLDFSIMFQGSHGAEVRNIGDHYLFSHNNNRTLISDVVPDSYNTDFLVDKYFTNSVIQDASYIALRNINIGYSFPENLVTELGLSKLRVYASGQNLLYKTADGYTGWNPEALDKTSPTQYGYQRGGSPIYRTISFGLDVDF